ncbi:hypothetical protein F5Y19DRAFT_410867 [Xylariaceae sp. FL1651]|nr:hypothetical protein F5Y19DRAFT_410867 [Xylariaceae sp. FL1651]
MSSLLHKEILLIGLRSDSSLPPYFRDFFGTPEEIDSKLDADHARIKRAGFIPVVLLIDSQEQEKGLNDLEAHLHRGKYDAIGIGAGLRVIPQYTGLFETMVNMCRTIAPSIPLMFNDGPGSSTESLERVLGVRIA